MNFFGVARRCAAGILLSAILAGCNSGSDSQWDEQREPNYLAGIRLMQERDYKGAQAAFEKALEVNPHSALAHFELAALEEDAAKMNGASDPAAAIYHYERFLKYCGNKADNKRMETAQQHVVSCKQTLAESISTMGPTSLRQKLDVANQENKELKAQLARWQTGQPQVPPSAPPSPPAGGTVAPRPGVVPARARPVVPPAPSASVNPTGSGAAATIRAAPVSTTVLPTIHPATSAGRTHTIKSGETPSAIARKYGVSVNALMAANPKAHANHLQVGQTLVIPAP